MEQQNSFVSVEDQEKLAPDTQEQDKVIPFPEDVPSIAEVIEGQAESEGFEFPEEIKNTIRDTLQKQFSNGLRVGTNAITAVIYNKIGNGKVNFNELEKDELITLLDGVTGFCETGLSQEFLKLLDDDTENAEITENTETDSE